MDAFMMEHEMDAGIGQDRKPFLPTLKGSWILENRWIEVGEGFTQAVVNDQIVCDDLCLGGIGIAIWQGL